jgi:hypothetical protein
MHRKIGAARGKRPTSPIGQSSAELDQFLEEKSDGTVIILPQALEQRQNLPPRLDMVK